MKKCKGCRYWSELLAQSLNLGPVEAMCLCEESPKYQQYTVLMDDCDKYQEGYPVDAPH